jgi:CheY-like chemotaxis protein
MGTDIYHILVVDDEKPVRSVVSAMLTKMGVKVTAADSGEQGLDFFSGNKFDLVITDYDMPGITGMDLAEQIKKESPATLIVLITGSEKGVNLARNKDNPIDQVLFKPFTFAEMAETVQGLLHC